MRRIRIIGTGFAAAVALAALTASGAQAANKLVLSSGGKPLKNGATAFSELSIATCLEFSKGVVTTNNEAQDKLSFTKIVDSECEPEFGASGGIETVELTAGGVAKYKANFELTVPGPSGSCVYSFTKFKGHFLIPGAVVVEEEQVGKLKKRRATRRVKKPAKSCSKRMSTSLRSGPLSKLRSSTERRAGSADALSAHSKSTNRSEGVVAK